MTQAIDDDRQWQQQQSNNQPCNSDSSNSRI